MENIKWKNLKDEQPNVGGYYLVYCPDWCESGMAVSLWDNEYFEYQNSGDMDGFVTHWANLPEEPITE